MAEMLKRPMGTVLLAGAFLAAGLAGIVAFWAAWPRTSNTSPLAALFALGAVFLWRKPQQSQVAMAVAGAPSQPAVSQAVERIASEARQSLDHLKDALFRLEIRRQAGMITEPEYAAERARIEGTLRDLVKD